MKRLALLTILAALALPAAAQGYGYEPLSKCADGPYELTASKSGGLLELKWKFGHVYNAFEEGWKTIQYRIYYWREVGDRMFANEDNFSVPFPSTEPSAQGANYAVLPGTYGALVTEHLTNEVGFTCYQQSNYAFTP